jgi:hypothetical protein
LAADGAIVETGARRSAGRIAPTPEALELPAREASVAEFKRHTVARDGGCRSEVTNVVLSWLEVAGRP